MRKDQTAVTKLLEILLAGDFTASEIFGILESVRMAIYIKFIREENERRKNEGDEDNVSSDN